MEATITGLVIGIGECIAGPVKRQFNYLCCFNNNIQILRDEAQKLKDAEKGLQMRVDAAKNNAQEIYPQVETWLECASKSEDIISGIQNDIPNIQKGCLNLISRYSLSRKAKKTAEALRELHNNCNFEQISQDTPPPVMRSLPLGPKEEFETRKKIEEDVMECLRDKKINITGLWGMGGIGKTTMAERIMDRVKEEKLFDGALKVVVSQQVEMLKIQQNIANQLGLSLDAEDLATRAHKIHIRLTDTKSTLVVLDDVWEGLKLEDLGIPCKNTFERCKVLFASRDRGVLEAMETQKIFGMQVLCDKEAWCLFTEKTGNCATREDLHSVAEDVAKECKGLPVALVTVGGALRNKTSRQLWEDALVQLRSSNPEDLPRVLSHVYKPLKLSYDYLENPRARSLFLLCSMFEEDFNIDLEILTRYGVALDLFERLGNLNEARNRTHALIERLKDRSLLLDGSDQHHVKMHDVVRDMAIYIAPEEQRGGFVVSQYAMLMDWTSQENYYRDCYWISITDFCNGFEFPVELKYPGLRLLTMQSRYTCPGEWRMPDSYFEGVQEIRVLFMKHITIRKLPPTTQLLKNLKTLHLDDVMDLGNISIVGGLLHLEILTCHGCNSIAELPIEIGKLSCLRLLEIIDCRRLTRIVPGVISNLINLEELKIRMCFGWWEAKESGVKQNAALVELESLTRLTCLEIEIYDQSLAAEEICLPSKIVKYDIAITKNQISTLSGSSRIYFEIPRHMNMGNWIKRLMRSAEDVDLERDGANYLNLVELQKTKSLALRSCSSMKKLVNTTAKTNVFPLLESLIVYNLEDLEEIIPGGYCYNDNYSCFRNLKSIDISMCPCLHSLFPVSVAIRGLSQLEVLSVRYCEAIEDIFSDGKINSHNLHMAFPKLKYLKLENLPRLMAQETLDKIAASSNLIDLCLRGLKVDTISSLWWLFTSFGNLTWVAIGDFNGIKNLISPSIAKNLEHLQKLTITSCKMMLEVIADDDREVQVMGHVSLFPRLEILILQSLPKLRSFCQWNHHNTTLELPSLRLVTIINCFQMETLTQGSLTTPRLEYVRLHNRFVKTKDLNKAIQQQKQQRSGREGKEGEACSGRDHP